MALLVTLLLCSCNQDKTDDLVEESEKPSLIIQISADNTEPTRGVSDDPNNANSTWTPMELLTDGSRLYRATLLLVDENNILIGTKDFDDDIRTSRPTEVTATFTNLKPNTTYKLYAIANYSAIDSWAGLANFPNIAGVTVGNDITTTINALTNYTLPDTGTDYIVSKTQVQPLSLVMDITTPVYGSKQVNAELLRTYARLRIEIENRSENQDLRVNSIVFGSNTSNFGYHTTPLMPVADDNIPNANGRLDFDATDAITAFVNNKDNPLIIPKLDLSDPDNNNSAVAFDAYIYENKNTNGFNYSMNLGFGKEVYVETTKYVKGDGANSPTGSADNIYMIGYYRSGKYRYLTANNNGVGVTTNDKTEFDNQAQTVFWEIEHVNGNTYNIRSVSQDSYLDITSDAVLNENTANLTINSQNIYKPIYIKRNGDNDINVGTGDALDFYFFPISKKGNNKYVKGQRENSPTGSADNIYMIGYNRNGTYRYLTANNNGSVGMTTNNNTEFNKQEQTVFWEIEHVNGNTYTIRSVTKDRYLDITTSDVVLNGNAVNLTINSQNIYNPRYIKRNGDNDINVGTENALDFYFFPISKETGKEIVSEGIERDFDIPLSTIIDGVSKPTNIIRRNDFINVLVTVSYNENSGTINFHVSDWNTGKGGDITFD